eukprot:2005979-Pyramimonas_sp.AAC.1
MEIKPAYHPHVDDGSDRYIAAKCSIKDTGVVVDEAARARQFARNPLREYPAPSYHSEKKCRRGERLAAATRHKLLHNSNVLEILAAAPSFDEFDGWVELPELLDNWPPEGREHYHKHHLEMSGAALASAIGHIRHWLC